MNISRVLVSIVSWNNCQQTLDCIASVLASEDVDVEIVLVDNASDDDTVEQVRGAYPSVIIIENDSNIGYAGAHEAAIAIARSRSISLLLIMNNDISVGREAISNLIKAYSQCGEAIYGAVPLAGDTSQQIETQRVLIAKKFLQLPYSEHLFPLRPYLFYGDVFGNHSPDEQRCYPVAAISGSVMLLPLSIVHTHGFIDTNFFLYSEEIDYCFRLQSAGIPSYLVTNAIVQHIGSASSSISDSIKDVTTYYRIRNQIIRIRRYQSWVMVFGVIIKNILLLVLLIAQFNYTRAQFLLLGINHGIRGIMGKTIAPEKFINTKNRN